MEYSVRFRNHYHSGGKVMNFDVVIVGSGLAGLSVALRLLPPG